MGKSRSFSKVHSVARAFDFKRSVSRRLLDEVHDEHVVGTGLQADENIRGVAELHGHETQLVAKCRTWTDREVPLGRSDLPGWNRTFDPLARLPPRGEVVDLHETALPRAALVEKQQASVGRGALEDLLGAKMHDMRKMPALRHEGAERPSVLRIEELIRQDETQPAPRVQELQAAFHEHDIDVVIAAFRRAVQFLVSLDLQGARSFIV